MSIGRELAVGIVGTGQIGAEVHLPVLLCTPGLRVAWVADRDETRAKGVAQSFGVRHQRLPDDPADLPTADVVVLAIPYGVRPPYFAALGKAGAATYVEKPFARTVAEHDAHAAPFASERIAVGYKFRASGAARRLRDLVRAAMFGPLESMSVRFGWPGVSTAGRYSSSLAMAGGGVLFEVACHYLDLALFVSDATTVQIANGHMVKDEGFDLHTEAVVEVVTAAGTKVGLDVLVTNFRHTSMTLVCRFAHADVSLNVWSDGALHARSRRNGVEIAVGGAGDEHVRTPYQLAHAQWLDFANAIRTQKENDTSAIRSRVTTALIEQLYALPGGAT